MSKPVSIAEIQAATGLGRDTVKLCIRSGELPGYVCRGRYVVPREAFDAFCRGEWKPEPRRQFGQPLVAIGRTGKERTA